MKRSLRQFNAMTAARVWCLAFLALLPAMGAPLDWTVDLLPSPDLAAPQGSTVQWNYLIKNLSETDTLVLNTLDAGVFQHGMPLSIFDFPIVAPLASASGGLYQFTWDSNAPLGLVNPGMFVSSADFYMGDPTVGGTFDTAAPGKSVDYSVTVVNTTVPEPGGVALMFAILPVLGWKLRPKTWVSVQELDPP